MAGLAIMTSSRASEKISSLPTNHDLEGERTVVLSFRSLQLERIKALQDQVLDLQMGLDYHLSSRSLKLQEINILQEHAPKLKRELTYLKLSNPTGVSAKAAVRVSAEEVPAKISAKEKEIDENASKVSAIQKEIDEVVSKVSAKQKEIDEALNSYAAALRNYETLSQNFLQFIPRDYEFAKQGPLSVAVSNYLSILTLERKQTMGRNFPDVIFWWISSRISQIFRDPHKLPTTAESPLTKGSGEGVGPRINRLRGGQDVSDIEKSIEAIAHSGFRELDKEGREERERRKANTTRLRMGLFACASLLGPMLIMAFNPTRNVALITTSTVTIAFAFLIAYGARDSSGKDVLLVTAAYAAVFVVFVGSTALNAVTTPTPTPTPS